MNKNEFLDYIKSNYPNMGVLYLNQVSKVAWDTEKIISNLTFEERELVNLRRQFPDEIILDIEEKFKLSDIRKKLDENKWTFEIWDTGSRGIHVSIRFENLGSQPLELRNRIRKYLINEFQTDERLSKESQWLAMEHSKHFKTEKEKVLLENVVGGKNVISNEIINYCQQILETNKQNKEVLISDEDFKDFIKDPYLKYCLGRQIVDGERNDVLFKNLAVGLVRSGLSKEEIFKIAYVIVNNCPGKTIGEFMGWVEKAFIGEITEYNKSEMLSWAQKYGHPILYKLWSDDEMEKLLTIEELWSIIWNGRIKVQPIWKDLLLYNMIGTILNEKDEDLRVHIIFSSFSGTGKDEGIILAKEILDDLGYKTSTPASVTDRTLVGAVNPGKVDFNIKWSLSENEEDAKGHKYKDPIEFGLLAEMDWIAFSESESVFKPSQWNKQLQIILRQAMDRAKRVEKGVGGERITFNTHTSFVFATYPMADAIYKILNNGLFQRAIYYNRELTKDDHRAIMEHIGRTKFNNTIKKNYDEKLYKKLLVDKLKLMKIWYEENKHSFTEFEGCDVYTDRKWKELEYEYEILPQIDKNTLDSVLRRGYGMLSKLSTLTMAMKMKTIIDKKDIDVCFKLIKDCVDSIKILVINQEKGKKQIFGVLQLLLEGEKTTMNLYGEMSEKIGIKSPNTQVKMMNKLKDLEYVTERFEGSIKKFSITEKGKNSLEE